MLWDCCGHQVYAGAGAVAGVAAVAGAGAVTGAGAVAGAVAGATAGTSTIAGASDLASGWGMRGILPPGFSSGWNYMEVELSRYLTPAVHCKVFRV